MRCVQAVCPTTTTHPKALLSLCVCALCLVLSFPVERASAKYRNREFSTTPHSVPRSRSTILCECMDSRACVCACVCICLVVCAVNTQKYLHIGPSRTVVVQVSRLSRDNNYCLVPQFSETATSELVHVCVCVCVLLLLISDAHRRAHTHTMY